MVTCADHLATLAKQEMKFKSSRETKLTHDDMHNIDVSDLGAELKALSRYISAGSTPKAVLEYMCTNKMTNLFPNAFAALQILLTLPVTAASGERSFFKLKLIKTHLRSTMTHERLVSLATISIEHELAQTVDLQQEAVKIFATKKARKAPL
uniref:HAT C-terminal dimerisation domain-containing protein n=1 Tax=Gopherus agassizii TaxID=38772 RepID=A0A452HZQ5_9SAUR